jgi:hypothetical protein
MKVEQTRERSGSVVNVPSDDARFGVVGTVSIVRWNYGKPAHNKASRRLVQLIVYCPL